MENKETRLVSAETLAKKMGRDASFFKGYTDAIKSVPFNYDQATCFAYERGRAFALYTKLRKTPKATWRKGVLSNAATERLIMAMKYGYIL